MGQRNKLILVYGKNRYVLNVRKAKCTKRGCDLFKEGVCDGDSDKMPCDGLFNAIQKIGFIPENGPTFRKIS